jgi:hypothetical protein
MVECGCSLRNRYAYVLNGPLANVDPDGLECVWDDGSYDGKNGGVDEVTTCQKAGGAWVELGQNGNWSGKCGDIHDK